MIKMKIMKRLESGINHLIEGIGRLSAWLSLFMVILATVIVFGRYVLSIGYISLQELVIYMNATMVALGVSYTYLRNEHVRIDFLYNNWSPRTRAFIDLFGIFFLLLPSLFVIIWFSWDFVASAWRISESSQQAGGLPFVFLPKSLLIIMPCLLFLMAINKTIAAIRQIIHPKVDDL